MKTELRLFVIVALLVLLACPSGFGQNGQEVSFRTQNGTVTEQDRNILR